MRAVPPTGDQDEWNRMNMATVRVDFNAIDENNMVYACHPEHCSEPVTEGQRVWLAETGLRCQGFVTAFANYGRGDLVYCRIIPGTWEDT